VIDPPTSASPKNASWEEFLPDKVYALQAPADTLEFRDLYLEEDYLYLIYIEIVTPHNVSCVEIRITDPDDNVFKVFKARMVYEEPFTRWWEIPFGTVMKGNYTIHFDITTEENFNLLVNVQKSVHSLYDQLDAEDIQGLVFYKTNVFKKDQYIEHQVDLKSDHLYHFYVGRLNAVSEDLNPAVRIDLSLVNPDGIEYFIFQNKRIADLDGKMANYTEFSFGTSTAGDFRLQLKVKHELAQVNLGYSVADLGPLTDEMNVNKTGELTVPEDDMNNESRIKDTLSNHTSVPSEFMAGTLAFVGIVSGVTIGLFARHKGKSKLEFHDFKEPKSAKK
jgi:hypothetical protein